MRGQDDVSRGAGTHGTSAKLNTGKPNGRMKRRTESWKMEMGGSRKGITERGASTKGNTGKGIKKKIAGGWWERRRSS